MIMKKLVMTRVEWAQVIARISLSLRYHVDQVNEMIANEDSDQYEILSHEIDLRQDARTLEQLLSIMDDII